MTLRLTLDGTSVSLKQFVFPGGEVNVAFNPAEPDLPHYPSVAKITASITNSDTLMGLFLLTDAVRRQYKDIDRVELALHYVPYARQDRVMVPGESLSIRVLCNLINSQKYSKVIIWDPHSDVTPALLNNCESVSQADLANYVLTNGIINPANTVLVAPDAGAIKKISEVAKALEISEVARADKVRDPGTGKITGTAIYHGDIGSKDFLIVDDICDGGFTFLELAKILRPLTTGKIILYVTHGIFSKGLKPFEGVIDEIYTANSFFKYPMNVNLLEYYKPSPVETAVIEPEVMSPLPPTI